MNPRTSRWRQPTAFQEMRTNAWAAHIGFMAGRGYSSHLIAEKLDDGTTDATIRKMLRNWELPIIGRKQECMLSVPLTVRQRANISARATQNELSPAEYCRRILVSSSMPTDLYSAIVLDPGAFE